MLSKSLKSNLYALESRVKEEGLSAPPGQLKLVKLGTSGEL